eukprot:2084063-Amphidinium_carterae.1
MGLYHCQETTCQLFAEGTQKRESLKGTMWIPHTSDTFGILLLALGLATKDRASSASRRNRSGLKD